MDTIRAVAGLAGLALTLTTCGGGTDKTPETDRTSPWPRSHPVRAATSASRARDRETPSVLVVTISKSCKVFSSPATSC